MIGARRTHTNASPMRRTTTLALLACAAAAAGAACADPNAVDQPCQRLVGDVRVVVDSAYATGFRLAAGDSVQVGASVRRIESARAVMITNVTVCEAEFGDPLENAVSFETTNANIAAVRPSGYVVGVSAGFAGVTVRSDAGVEPAQFPVEVTQ